MTIPARLLNRPIARALYAGLVTLVLGGLASVTWAALAVEEAQRRATLASEAAGKERVALWRLDGQLFPAVALENSRPFAHYTPLHAAAWAIDANGPTHDFAPGGVRLPSPLVSAELPDWMPLHFQLDPDAGWTSPQVPPPDLADRLRAAGDAANLTDERARLLQSLRVDFPTTEALAVFSERNPSGDPGGAFVVPVLDAAEPSVPKPPDIGTPAADARPDGLLDSGRENPLPPRTVPDAVAGLGRSNSTVVPPDAGNLMNNTAPNNRLATQATPLAVAQAPYPPMSVTPGANAGEYDARARAANQMMQRPSVNPGGIGGQGGFGGGIQGGFGGQGGIQGGGFGGGFGGTPPPGGLGNAFNNDSSVARNGMVLLAEDVIAGARAARKGPPTLPPVAVQVGPMRAEWLAGPGGERLVLVRAARLEAKTVYQGVLLDWPRLRAALAAEVADLFPGATITPVRPGDPPRPERVMAALPAQLDPGDAPAPAPPGITPLRLALLIAWATVLLAVAAVGFGGHALLDLSERRIRFVAAVTHELRTPLTSLRLYLDLLTSGLVDGDEQRRRDYLRTLAAESDRLHRLVENVLDFARLENRRVEAALRPVAVSGLLNAVAHAWTGRCVACGKTLVVHSLVPPGQQVLADAGIAEQVLGNLIDNACKYSRDAADGRVWLWAKPDGRGRVAFEVEDRGPGVPAAERAGVFEPFRRGDAADAAVGGAGLGLSLARHWSAQLGGRLTYRPADGGTGACFRLTVRAADCAGLARATGTPRPHSAAARPFALPRTRPAPLQQSIPLTRTATGPPHRGRLMGIRVALSHTTTYSYDRPVTLLPHVVRLRPAPHARTPVVAYSLKVEPGEHFLNWQQDPYSNHLARLVFPKPARKLKVTVDLVAEMVPVNPFDFFLESSAESFPFEYDEATKKELAPYLEAAPLTPKVAELVAASRKPAMPTNDFIVALNQSIAERVEYVIRLEPGVQDPEETLTKAKGSCRDSAWLLVQVARHLGLAARFCSGYLIQLVSDEKTLDGGPSGPPADFTDLHAWVELYLPGAGWVGLDPTSGLLAAEGHIPLACTAAPQTAAAISGGFAWDQSNPDEKLGESFDFQMTVTRVRETPRVTKPYTEVQWDAINRLGRFIDRDLAEQDVRLTMGGEPTFVSIDHRDADEWNTAANGPLKREAAMELAKRLRVQFAPGGFLHFGQGKWYPGESLPRWAFGCYWRKDGHPVWRDQSLVADEAKPRGFTAADAKRFLDALAGNLGITSDHAVAGYEDAWYYLWQERKLPANVDPLDSKLANAEDRARLAKVFEQGLDSVVGYALPLRKSPVNRSAWETGSWSLRKEHLFLYPGDSPMGLRLPLDSLPWEPKEDRQFLDERDPFAPRGPLPTRTLLPGEQPDTRPHHERYPEGEPASRAPFGELPTFGRNGVAGKPPGFAGTPGQAAPANVVRTALCVETRGGSLYVFMPPLQEIEDYLELVSALEATAAALDMPILVEGYKPPFDPRVNLLGVTPDPGVIEVNTHPVADWEELVHNTTTLYEEARLTRLCTEKFLLDGRHTGTGGGNHVVLGGPTPADSPVLRRPDLLKSFIGCWNNHPSLSYLFSGLFVGPTSQHPRADEARHDALDELDLAFHQVSVARPTPPAWLVDRVFRHLLVDSSGNTHRTELCIDKLFSPDSAAGRLGLLELRGFEMPPHAEMSCAQQLLIRALVASFWRRPYERPMVRWGTELHDRFMLPHFVEQDFNDLLDELAQGGYPIDPAWFAPHREFRFPLIGDLASLGVHLELRTAIEPWHVLGEEAGAGGTVRYVDSSVERVQVKVHGMTDPRHVLTCNGRRVPLHPTGRNGEFVAGVRYRAWQPPSCYHPTIPSHAPLVFDLLDGWNDRSLGGCVYHVAHPGGRAHERFPVNGREAEGRRMARFQAFGHTPGSVVVPPAELSERFPFTLDLRTPEPPRYGQPTPPPVNAPRLNGFGRQAGVPSNAAGVLE